MLEKIIDQENENRCQHDIESDDKQLLSDPRFRKYIIEEHLRNYPNPYTKPIEPKRL
jgi:hypothetical protein